MWWEVYTKNFEGIMNKVIRILDVNFNRIREGLRVIEETLRFIYRDEKNLKKIRDLRHLISKKIFEYIPPEILKSSRDIEQDIGKKFKTEEKGNFKGIIEKNFLRIEEAARCLEEYGKIVNKQFSNFFHSVRFKIYQIEKDILTYISRKKIKVPILYVILNLKEDEGNFLKFAKKVIEAKPEIIQLRYKGENIRHFSKIAKELKKIIPDEIIYLINDRIDISIICESDGVHIGQKDIEIEDVRKLIPEKIVGISTGNISEIKKVKNQDVDYVAIGSVFPSPTKPEKKVIGTEILKTAKKYISIPLIGIGGINIENVKKAIENGADGVAVISAVENSEDPVKTIKKLKEEIYKGWKKRKSQI